MLEEILARRAAVKSLHAALESRPGTGWHRNDPGSPRLADTMPLSERPVAFVADRKVFLAGDCAAAVGAAAARYHARESAERDAREAAAAARLEALRAERKAAELAGRTAVVDLVDAATRAVSADGDPQTERSLAAAAAYRVSPEGLAAVDRSEWNDLLHAVAAEGVLVAAEHL